MMINLLFCDHGKSYWWPCRHVLPINGHVSPQPSTTYSVMADGGSKMLMWHVAKGRAQSKMFNAKGGAWPPPSTYKIANEPYHTEQPVSHPLRNFSPFLTLFIHTPIFWQVGTRSSLVAHQKISSHHQTFLLNHKTSVLDHNSRNHFSLPLPLRIVFHFHEWLAHSLQVIYDGCSSTRFAWQSTVPSSFSHDSWWRACTGFWHNFPLTLAPIHA